jgi:hypothetical protein
MNNKKCFRKIPKHIAAKLATLQAPLVASVVLVVPKASINEERFAPLKLTLNPEGMVQLPEAWVPEIQGRISRENRTGRIIVRKDLPKIWKTFSFESPNFGNWSRGSHEVQITREVYQREFDPPREMRIRVLGVEGKPDCYQIMADGVLDLEQPDFGRRLLFCINLMQEAFGFCGVISVDAVAQELADSIEIAWELLPPATLSQAALLERFARGRTGINPLVSLRFEQRRRLLENLHPQHWIIGQSGFRRYFGAKFGDDFVVFENLEYGNALYALHGDWTSLSQLSRIALLARDEGVTRIVHRTGWEEKLRKLVEKHRGKPPEQQQSSAA